MPTREDIAYFGAGPSGLPTHVAAAGSQAFFNYEDSGVGLAEISHRSPTATQILADTKAALISFLAIPDNYEILFLHGGGSGEFSAVVYNLVPVWVEKRRKRAEQELGGDESAIVRKVREDIQKYLRLDYLVTGSWSLKASQEAAQLLAPLGENLINVALDARISNEGAFGTIPSEDSWRLTDSQTNGTCGSAFVYYCDNETVDGVEFSSFPGILESQPGREERIVVADMSSNILSRQVDVSKYGVIFAGAQKVRIGTATGWMYADHKEESRYHRHHFSHCPQRSSNRSTSRFVSPCGRGLVSTYDCELANHCKEQFIVQHHGEFKSTEKTKLTR